MTGKIYKSYCINNLLVMTLFMKDNVAFEVMRNPVWHRLQSVPSIPYASLSILASSIIKLRIWMSSIQCPVRRSEECCFWYQRIMGPPHSLSPCPSNTSFPYNGGIKIQKALKFQSYQMDIKSRLFSNSHTILREIRLCYLNH